MPNQMLMLIALPFLLLACRPNDCEDSASASNSYPRQASIPVGSASPATLSTAHANGGEAYAIAYLDQLGKPVFVQLEPITGAMLETSLPVSSGVAIALDFSTDVKPTVAIAQANQTVVVRLEQGEWFEHPVTYPRAESVGVQFFDDTTYVQRLYQGTLVEASVNSTNTTLMAENVIRFSATKGNEGGKHVAVILADGKAQVLERATDGRWSSTSLEIAESVSEIAIAGNHVGWTATVLDRQQQLWVVSSTQSAPVLVSTGVSAPLSASSNCLENPESAPCDSFHFFKNQIDIPSMLHYSARGTTERPLQAKPTIRNLWASSESFGGRIGFFHNTMTGGFQFVVLSTGLDTGSETPSPQSCSNRADD